MIKILCVLFILVASIGCSGIPVINDWKSVAADKENIEFLINYTNAKIIWNENVDSAKVFPDRAKTNLPFKLENQAEIVYLVDGSPILVDDEIYVQKKGIILVLNKIDKTVKDNYLLDFPVLIDGFDNYIDEVVIPFITGDFKQSYFIINKDKKESRILSKVSKTDKIYYKYTEHRIISAIYGNINASIGTVYIGNVDKLLFSFPEKGFNGLRNEITGKGDHFNVRSLISVLVKDNILMGLYLKRDDNYFLVGFDINKGEVLWTRLVKRHYDPVEETTLFAFVNQDKVILTEISMKTSQIKDIFTTIVDIKTGDEFGVVKGAAYNGLNEVKDKLFYWWYDNNNNKIVTQFFNYSTKTIQDVKLPKINPLFGIIQIKDYLYYVGGDFGIDSKQYDTIYCINKETGQIKWSAKIGKRTILPVINKDSIYVGDPLGKGNIANCNALTDEDLNEDAIVLEAETGKILWQAKISNNGKITRMIVDVDKAYIKTLKGNLFAIEWEGNK